MDAKLYEEILQDFIPFADEYMGKGVWLLQQDGASSHTAKTVDKYLKSQKVETYRWPPRSPDLNPVENVWAILKKKVKKRNAQTAMELENAIFEEWEQLNDDDLGKIAGSFNLRLEKVIEAEGEIIDY